MNPWPFEDRIIKESLPIGIWHTDGWKGIKVEWNELVQLTSKDAAEKLTELFFIARKSFH